MLKRFSDYSAALDFGREFGDSHRCRVYTATIYDHANGGCVATHFVASPSSLHLLRNFGAGSYCPVFGWHSGHWETGSVNVEGTVDPRAVALMSEPDRDALPGDQERIYSLFAGNTCGFTPDEIREMSAEMEKNKSCVWHEAYMMAVRKGRTDANSKCHCAKCSPPKPTAKPKARRVRR